MHPSPDRLILPTRFENVSGGPPDRVGRQRGDLTHVQVVVNIPREAGGGKTHIDLGIARLLLAAWQHGWSTLASCEASDAMTAQIIFNDEHDAISFIVTAGFPDRVEVKVPSPCRWSRRPVPVAVYFDRAWIDPASAALRQAWMADHDHLERSAAQVTDPRGCRP
jgi:hypothetical protein